MEVSRVPTYRPTLLNVDTNHQIHSRNSCLGSASGDGYKEGRSLRQRIHRHAEPRLKAAGRAGIQVKLTAKTEASR